MSFAITMLGILGERPRNAKPFFSHGGETSRAAACKRQARHTERSASTAPPRFAPEQFPLLCPYQLKRPLPLRLLA